MSTRILTTVRGACTGWSTERSRCCQAGILLRSTTETNPARCEGQRRAVRSTSYFTDWCWSTCNAGSAGQPDPVGGYRRDFATCSACIIHTFHEARSAIGKSGMHVYRLWSASGSLSGLAGSWKKMMSRVVNCQMADLTSARGCSEHPVAMLLAPRDHGTPENRARAPGAFEWYGP